MTTIWYCEQCEKCGKRNYIYNGDPEDITVPDVQGYRCWYCDSVNWFDYEDDAFVDNGVRCPPHDDLI